MLRLLLFLLLTACSGAVFSQKNDPYVFKDVKQLAATAIKSQDKTGTCWAFSTVSFLESELLRMGKGEVDLSEMFIVRNMYVQKCENYIRRQGAARFGEGGLAHDVVHAVRHYGLMPQAAYPGNKNGDAYNHAALESKLKAACARSVKEAEAGQLSPRWQKEIAQILDEEFGVVPLKFVVGPTEFTALTYRDFLEINPDDYVNLTSFTHHPFYENFILEVPDNWANGSFFNLPLDELLQSLNFVLQSGYTVEWDTDVSNKGFDASGQGLAIVPEKDWATLTAQEQEKAFTQWMPEKNVSQTYRQQLFDRQETMDDHLMHITGILDEAHTGIYYAVKNSWGQVSPRKGYINVSEAYMRLNTISFTVHKNALPVNVRRRMGLEAGEVMIETPKKKGQRAASGVEPAPGFVRPPANRTAPTQKAPANAVKEK